MSDEKYSRQEIESRSDRSRRMIDLLKITVDLYFKLGTVLLLFFVVIYIIKPGTGLLEQYVLAYSARQAVEERTLGVVPELERKIQNITATIDSLSSSLIENRILRIERSLELGQLDTATVSELNQFKQEFDRFKSLVTADTTIILDIRTLSQDYKSIKEQLSHMAKRDDIARDVSVLKDKMDMYVTIFGIILGAASLLIPAFFFVYKFRSEKKKED